MMDTMDMQQQLQCLIDTYINHMRILLIIAIFSAVLLINGCSSYVADKSKYINCSSCIYTIQNQKNVKYFLYLKQDKQDKRNSYFSIFNNKFYGKVSFIKLTVYLEGMYKNNMITHLKAFHVDNRFHPITLYSRIGVKKSKIEFVNSDEKANILIKLVSPTWKTKKQGMTNDVIKINTTINRVSRKTMLNKEKKISDSLRHLSIGFREYLR